MHHVEVFADIGCPFTHVGLRRLLNAAEAKGVEVALACRAWPLELVNGRPMDPERVAAQVQAIRSQVAPDLFTGFDPDAFPATFPNSTLPSLALVAAAAARSAAQSTQLALRLRWLLFEEAADLDDPAVLTGAAAEAGLEGDLDALVAEGRMGVEADWAEGRERGVVGSPHFFVGDAGYFCPALDISRGDDGLSIRPSPDRFDAFLAEALG